MSQAEIDARVSAVFDLEEPDIVFDLRHVYSGNASKFDLFWAKAKEFLEEDIGTAVDDRRHSEVVYTPCQSSFCERSKRAGMCSMSVSM